MARLALVLSCECELEFPATVPRACRSRHTTKAPRKSLRFVTFHLTEQSTAEVYCVRAYPSHLQLPSCLPKNLHASDTTPAMVLLRDAPLDRQTSCWAHDQLGKWTSNLHHGGACFTQTSYVRHKGDGNRLPGLQLPVVLEQLSPRG